MKKIILIAVALLSFYAQSFAQNPVTMLQHNGISTPYVGIASFNAALSAAVDGDTLCLSAGTINAPSPITKKLTIIGAGHFGGTNGRTYINGSLTINKGADSLQVEGLYISEEINFDANNPINYVKIKRCRINGVNFSSSSSAASKNYCTIEECYIPNGINFSKYGINLLVKNSILSYITNINGNAIIDGNILFGNPGIANVHNSLIQNNIFLAPAAYNYTFAHQYSNSYPNNFLNNLFVVSSVDFGSNSSASNNYFGVPQANIFVNQTGTSINYAHDYHLKNPELYLGTDGTQVGIYGGSQPFKDNGLPSNPQITQKNIGKQTDADGNLQIDITVKAQER